MKFKWVACAALAVSAGGSMAAYRCVSPDGRTAFQELPCASQDRSAPVPVQTGRAGRDWNFLKLKDDMTGRVQCTVESPSFPVAVDQHSRVKSVYFQAVWVGVSPSLVVRSSTTDSTFHIDYAGTGLRVNRGNFVGFEMRPKSGMLAFTDATSGKLIEQMKLGGAVRTRLRFWPYDTAYDSEELSLQGFKQAMALAEQCQASQR